MPRITTEEVPLHSARWLNDRSNPDDPAHRRLDTAVVVDRPLNDNADDEKLLKQNPKLLQDVRIVSGEDMSRQRVLRQHLKVSIDNLRLPLGHTRSYIRYQVEKKRLLRFVINFIVYLTFLFYMFPVGEAYHFTNLYREACEEVGVGASWTEFKYAEDANAFRSAALPAVAERIQERCASCVIMIDAAMWQADATRFVSNLSTAEKPTVKYTRNWLGFHSPWQLYGTLYIGTPSVDLVVVFAAKPQQPGVTDRIMATEEFQFVAPDSLASHLFVYLNVIRLLYRIFFLAGEALAFLMTLRSSLGYTTFEILNPWDGPKLTNVSVVVDIAAILVQLPIFFIWRFLVPASGVAFPLFLGKGIMYTALSVCLLLLVFLRLAQCWTPFKLFVGTMSRSYETLSHLAVVLIVVAIFAALSGQLMFGTEQGGMSSVWNSIFAVLDILMNSTERPLSDDSFFSFFIVAFYLLVNGVMLLIVSQFLIAILCDSFGECQAEVLNSNEQSSLPEGWQLCGVDEIHNESILGESICSACAAITDWNSYTCNTPNKILSQLFADEMQHGLTLLSFARLKDLLDKQQNIDTEQADVRARLLLVQFGCVPTSLVQNVDAFYSHRAEDFTATQIAGLACGFDRFDTLGDGKLNVHEFFEVSRFFHLGFDLERCFALVAEVDQHRVSSQGQITMGDGQLDFEEFLAALRFHAQEEHLRSGQHMALFSYRKFALKSFPQISDGSEVFSKLLNAHKKVVADRMYADSLDSSSDSEISISDGF